MRLVLSAAAAFLLAGCSTTTAVTLDRDFILRPRQRVVLPNGMAVRFDSLQGDNRCPMGALCIAQGNAEVLVSVEPGHGPDYQVLLNSDMEPRSALVTGYFIDLRQVRPIPVVGHAIVYADYRVMLRVRQALD